MPERLVIDDVRGLRSQDKPGDVAYGPDNQHPVNAQYKKEGGRNNKHQWQDGALGTHIPGGGITVYPQATAYVHRA